MIKKVSKAIVIGSGFGGIASALRLNKLGFKVTLVERLDTLGGRARVFQKEGYRHDAGPTVITAPFLFEELYELFDKKLSDYLDFVPLDPWYRFYFHDGKTFDYRPSIEDTNDEIRKFDKSDVEGYENLLKTSKDIFQIGFEKLSDKPFSSFWEMVKQVPALLKLKSYLTVSQMVNSKLKNEYLRKAFSIHPLLVGGNPFTTTSIYALIHYLERKWGVFFCMGGTGKIVHELEKLNNEIHRILKPGGINIYTVRHINDGDFKSGIHRGEDLYENEGFIVHYFSEEKVSSLLNGFKNITLEKFEEGKFPRKLFFVVNKKI